MLEKIQIVKQRFDEISDLIIQPDVIADQKRYVQLNQEYKSLNALVQKREEYITLDANVKEAQEIIADGSDAEMVEMAKMQLEEAKERLPLLEEEIKFMLIPKDPEDAKNVMVEIRAGTGGDEASIFAGDLYRMYTKYCEGRGWKCSVVDMSDGTSGGFKEVIFEVTGEDVYGALKYEAGVHRVQRVPQTETQGRVHTSAATVMVLPEAEEFDVEIDMNEVHPYISEGFGEDFVPENFDMTKIDHFEQVTDKDGAVMARRIAKEEGLFCGYSAGSCFQGLLQLKNKLKKDDLVVCIFHDHGTRYVGKIYNDQWMMERGFLEVKTFKDIVSSRASKQKLISVRPDQNVADAVMLMRKYEIEHIPVMIDDEILGAIKDSSSTITYANNDVWFDRFFEQYKITQDNKLKFLIYKQDGELWNLDWAGIIVMDLVEWANDSKPIPYTFKAIDGLAALKFYEYTQETLEQNTAIRNVFDILGLLDLYKFWGATDPYLRESIEYKSRVLEATTTDADSPLDYTYISDNFFIIPLERRILKTKFFTNYFKIKKKGTAEAIPLIYIYSASLQYYFINSILKLLHSQYH